MIEVPTVRRRLLGAEMRRLREAAGFTLDDSAQVLECDRSKISRIETGHRGVRPKELRELLTEYGVEEERRYALGDLARQTRKTGWWKDYNTILPEPYLELIAIEADAASEYIFDAHSIPALLQTEAYARHILGASYVAEATREQDELVAVCMARQRILRRLEPDPLHLRAIIGEAALRQMIGDANVMRDQLNRLIDIHSECPNVTFQILPFNVGAHVGNNSGPFAVVNFPPPTQLGIVHLDTLTGGVYLEAPNEIERFRRAMEYFASAALSADASMRLIEKTVKELPR
jgi:transcriptional regulator with XRE-family HTH domain